MALRRTSPHLPGAAELVGKNIELASRWCRSLRPCRPKVHARRSLQRCLVVKDIYARASSSIARSGSIRTAGVAPAAMPMISCSAAGPAGLHGARAAGNSPANRFPWKPSVSNDTDDTLRVCPAELTTGLSPPISRQERSWAPQRQLRSLPKADSCFAANSPSARGV